MKFNMEKGSFLLALRIAMICSISIFFSCTKNEYSDKILSNKLINLQVSVAIESMPDDDMGTKKTSSSDKEILDHRGLLYAGNIESYNTYDVQVSYGFKQDTKPILANSILGSKISALPSGIQYRLLLYNLATGELVINKLATSGTPLGIELEKGTTYNWIAYSYNKDDKTVLPDVVNYANPMISTGENMDFLYAKGNLTTPSNSVNDVIPLNINFQHKLRRIAVQLNTEGMFADLVSASITFDNSNASAFQKGNFNLLSGVVEGTLTDYNSIPIVSSFVQTPGYGFADRNLFYFYTANKEVINNAKIVIQNFTIKLDNNTNRTFNTSAVLNAFTIPAISDLGKSQMPNVNLIESPITLGSVKWARGNLYYTGDNEHNPYRFSHMNIPSSADNSFWGWRSLKPDAKVGTGDPCHQVYPVGTWKTPSPSEISNSLLNRTPTYNTGNPRNVSFAGVGNNSHVYPDGNNLRLTQNGYGTGIKILGFINLPLVGYQVNDYEKQVQLWSNDPTINVLNLVGVGVDYYQAQNGIFGILPPTDTKSQQLSSTTLGNVTLLGIDLINSGYKNVRCVRVD